jgi:hypothetical protein
MAFFFGASRSSDHYSGCAIKPTKIPFSNGKIGHRRTTGVQVDLGIKPTSLEEEHEEDPGVYSAAERWEGLWTCVTLGKCTDSISSGATIFETILRGVILGLSVLQERSTTGGFVLQRRRWVAGAGASGLDVCGGGALRLLNYFCGFIWVRVAEVIGW